MTDLVTQAAWVLIAAFVLSLAYELYRATAKAGTSPHDSAASLVKNNVALYVIAALVIVLLFAGFGWAPWVGLIFSAVVTAASILRYSRKIMLERVPRHCRLVRGSRVHQSCLPRHGVARLPGAGRDGQAVMRCLLSFPNHGWCADPKTSALAAARASDDLPDPWRTEAVV
jgi:hypothetical protein